MLFHVRSCGQFFLLFLNNRFRACLAPALIYMIDPLNFIKHGYQVCCMDDYKHGQLSQESLLFVVASTFGNGEPPENGTSFSDSLESMKKSSDARPLKNLR